MTLGDRVRREFLRLPPGIRRHLLHRAGRYAPWEPGFDFTPPAPAPGEVTGPPDFVGIGVQKAGTTWWYHLIASHPDVTSRPDIHKERHFFDRFGSLPFGAADIEQYHGWFPRAEGTLAGEWTPDYVTFSWAPELLKRAAPKARILVLLRDPVERFRSGRDHQRRMGVPENAVTTASAVQRGFYLHALDGWLEQFEPDQLLVLQYERCLADPVDQLEATFRFLELPEFVPPGLGEARTPPTTSSQPLPPEVKDRLVSDYESDVVALAERLPQIDLSLWTNFAYLKGGQERSEPPNSPTWRP
jgi:hypothetical protein